MNLTETVARPAVMPTDWPCRGACQVDRWPAALDAGRGRTTTPWCCPAFDSEWACSLHEWHSGPHRACLSYSDNPDHHGLHVWTVAA